MNFFQRLFWESCRRSPSIFRCRPARISHHRRSDAGRGSRRAFTAIIQIGTELAVILYSVVTSSTSCRTGSDACSARTARTGVRAWVAATSTRRSDGTSSSARFRSSSSASRCRTSSRRRCATCGSPLPCCSCSVCCVDRGRPLPADQDHGRHELSRRLPVRPRPVDGAHPRRVPLRRHHHRRPCAGIHARIGRAPELPHGHPRGVRLRPARSGQGREERRDRSHRSPAGFRPSSR